MSATKKVLLENYMTTGKILASIEKQQVDGIIMLMALMILDFQVLLVVISLGVLAGWEVVEHLHFQLILILIIN